MKREIFSGPRAGRDKRSTGIAAAGPARLAVDDTSVAGEVPTERRAASLARYMRTLRKERDAALPAGLAGEPAWDMLLDLYLAEESGRQMSIDELCRASGMAQSTAIRWISAIECSGFARRAAHGGESDGSVRITPEAQRRIRSYLTGAAERLSRDPDLSGHNLSLV